MATQLKSPADIERSDSYAQTKIRGMAQYITTNKRKQNGLATPPPSKSKGKVKQG